MNILTHAINKYLCLYGKSYNKEWSDKLEFIISNFDTVRIGTHELEFTVSSEVIGVWTSNKFYSYGHLWSVGGDVVTSSCMFRPSYRVMKRLHKLELEVIAKKEIEDKKIVDKKLQSILNP